MDPATETDTWARDALTRLARIPDVGRVGLALAEGGGRQLRFVASDRDNASGVDWCHVDAYEDVPLNTVVRSGRTVAGALEELEVAYPELIARQPATVRAIANVPIRAAGQVLGGFVLYYGRVQAFDAAQRAALEDCGAQLGVDLRRAQQVTARPSRSLADEPVPSGSRATTLAVDHDPRSVSGARAFVRTTLGGWGVDDETTEAAVLAASELVTNAIIHTSAGCELHLLLDDGVLTGTVRDAGSAVVRTSGAADPLAVHGRGLHVVQALSARWGSRLDEVGTTVWFVLETS